MFRPTTLLRHITFISIIGIPVTAQAAEIVLEQPAVLNLLKRTLYKRDGKYDLKKGACYAYLEQPSLEIKTGRISIRTRLSSRTGVEFSGSCLGFALASWATISGKPVSKGGAVQLEDIRIDQVEDGNTRALLQTGLVPKLPSVITLDVREMVSKLLQSEGGQFNASLDAFSFQGLQAEENKLSIRFDFRLLAR